MVIQRYHEILQYSFGIVPFSGIHQSVRAACCLVALLLTNFMPCGWASSKAYRLKTIDTTTFCY